MKYVSEGISVEAPKKVPSRIQWEGRVYRTRKLIDYWILQTRWWGREEKRIYFRLDTDRGLIEVYRAIEARTPGTSSVLSPQEPGAGSKPAGEEAMEGRVASRAGVGRDEATGGGAALKGGASAASKGGAGRGRINAGAASRTHRKPSHPPLPMEGDTHTRERRGTDAVYRPDVRMPEAARRAASVRESPASSPPCTRWVLSKILD